MSTETSPKLHKRSVPNPYLDSDLLDTLNVQQSTFTPVMAKSKSTPDSLPSTKATSNTDHRSDHDVDGASNLEESLLKLQLNDDSIITSNYDVPDELRDDTQRDTIEETKSPESDLIEINVGGTLYQCGRDTLCRYPSSKLAHSVQCGVAFFDRDGSVFQYILNYLRSDALVLPKSVHNDDGYILNQLLIESKHFRLDSLVDELVMLKLNSHILSTSTSNHLQKQHLLHIRRMIALEYPKFAVSHGAQEWKSLFKYDVATYSSPIPAATILQSKCGGTRSILIIFVAQNQIFVVYFYEVFPM